MKLNALFSLVIVCLLLSCKDSKPEQAVEFDQKMDKTIAIHDEVMPRMSEINKLLAQLETKMDSANTERYQMTMKKLENGHESMMSWMKSFSDEFNKTEINQGIQTKDVDSLKQRLKALEISYREAEDMKKEILEAIGQAERLLEK